MLVAMAGALLLVKQNQNTQRGAYFAGTKMFMQPAALTGKVGDTILVQLYAETEKIITANRIGGTGTGTDSSSSRCVEACPNSSQKNLLQNCTPPDSDGTSKDSLCNVAGRVEDCGGRDYCCPSVGGQWTTTMTACGGTSCGTKPAEQCAINANEGSMLRVRPVCTGGNWDFDDQLCNKAGIKDVCGGRDYCCPSVGGQWTTDMTACNGGIEEYAKISSIDTVVCYGSNLSINDPATQVILNEEALKNKLDASVVTINGKKCLRLVAVSDMAAKPEDLKGGMVKLVTIKFKAESAGTGSVGILPEKTKLGGYNPVAGATDTAIKIGTVTDASYTVSGVGSTVCNLRIDPPITCPTGYTCIEKNYTGPTPPGHRDGDGVCVLSPSPTPGGCNLTVNPPRICPDGYDCITTGNSDGADGVCVLRPSPTPTIPVTTDTPILNFKVTFGDVKKNMDTKCATDWPLQVIVLSSGATKVYTGIKVQEIDSSGNLVEYKGTMPLVGFNHLTNVAVFIKGPKHLQMKYATQNQSVTYNKAGGELTLTTSAATSPLYNFTGYSMLAGDIVGDSVEAAPNGVINGVDFAYLKSQPTLDPLTAGSYLQGDLDGNCQINSNDTVILKKSLETKQGELY